MRPRFIQHALRVINVEIVCARVRLEKKVADLDVMLGDPRRAIRSMIAAFFLALAVVQVNQFVDTFWVSGLGAEASSAVATAIPIYGLLMCAGLGIGTGVTAGIAFHLGGGDPRRADRVAGSALVLAVLFAAVGSIIAALLSGPAIELMGAGDVMDDCMQYLVPYIVLSPILLCETVIGSALRGEGAAKKAMIVQASAAVFNMAIDPILIYGLGLGVFGAGLATCVAAFLSMAIGLWWYLTGRTIVKLNRDAFVRDRQAVDDVMGIGGPKTIQTVISNATDLIQRVFIIAAGGTNAVMYYNYAWRYIELVNLPGRSYENAMIPVCSAGYGQEDYRKMGEGFAYATKMVLLFGIAFTAFILIFAEPLMVIMTYEESMAALRPEFVWTLRVSALLIPFSALMGIGSSMLQVMRRARLSMNFYFAWGFAKLALYAISAYIFDSFEGIIYSMVAIHVIGGVLLMWMGRREYRRIEDEEAGSAARWMHAPHPRRI